MTALVVSTYLALGASFGPAALVAAPPEVCSVNVYGETAQTFPQAHHPVLPCAQAKLPQQRGQRKGV